MGVKNKTVLINVFKNIYCIKKTFGSVMVEKLSYHVLTY